MKNLILALLMVCGFWAKQVKSEIIKYNCAVSPGGFFSTPQTDDDCNNWCHGLGYPDGGHSFGPKDDPKHKYHAPLGKPYACVCCAQEN